MKFRFSSTLRNLVLFSFWMTLLVTGLGLTIQSAPAAPAVTITVNTTADELNFDGDCSLREAIRAANTDASVDACPAGSGTDTISLPIGTINLTNVGSNDVGGDLDILSNLTMQGAGAGFTEIHGQMGERILEAAFGTEVTVKDVTISGGQDLTGGAGGGILSLGVFTLERSIVTGNTASSGGGVWNSGSTMTIIESTISNNTDNGNAGGAGLGGSPDTVTTLISSTVTENVTGHGAGGINTYNGTFILINSTVSNNINTSVSFGGAGIFISGAEAELYLINSTVSGNVSTDAVGGGLFINNGSTAYIFNSTIAYNSATSSGGIRNNGTINFQNTIIAQNIATTVGGAPDCGG
ncbi:MAG TPA: CSLREA domain-containing protein, partial [Anaerolineales bacterium]|nr:CSLREA domain-containing protein [Anaerolineales bacterium]